MSKYVLWFDSIHKVIDESPDHYKVETTFDGLGHSWVEKDVTPEFTYVECEGAWYTVFDDTLLVTPAKLDGTPCFGSVGWVDCFAFEDDSEIEKFLAVLADNNVHATKEMMENA